MSAGARLIEIVEALDQGGLPYLIMGGHAVRHYGVDRNTLDFDFHVTADSAPGLLERLRKTDFGSRSTLHEGVSWRPADFRRFQIGLLPGGKEEWLEFWFRNHLLAPFEELFARREDAAESKVQLHYLSLPDLIRSKETEREDDWNDVRLLEEILDGRHLAKAMTQQSRVGALSQLRSRRGFERAQALGLFAEPETISEALRLAQHPVTCAYLLPFVPDQKHELPMTAFDPAVLAALRRVQPGTARHLAVVEAVRLAYQRAAKLADRADKERQTRS